MIARYLQGFSERELAHFLAAFCLGSPIATEDNLNAMAEGRPYSVKTDQFRGQEGSKETRNKSVFHVLADNLLRRIRRLEQLPLETDDGRWFDSMVSAWMATLADIDDPVTRAAGFARVAGEIEYFERAMLPIINIRIGLAPHQDFLVPDFMPQDGA